MDKGQLFLELGALALGLSVLARMSRRAGLSAVPLYVLFGLAFGEGGLVPVITAEEFLRVGAELGVVLLLFMLGLDYDGEELLQGLRDAWRSSVLDAGLNFGAGFVAGLLLQLGWVGALVLGGITYASSSGIVSKLRSDLGWKRAPEGPGVVALLITEDLAMVLYLPLLGALLLGGALVDQATAVLAALVVAGVVLFVAVRFGNRISRAIFTDHAEAMLLGVFGLMLLVAGVAERFEISAAVGAFLVGIAINGHAQTAIRQQLRPMRDLFAAIFFTVFSLAVDPRDIPPVLAVALGLALVTGATKYATGMWLAHRRGVDADGQRRAGAILLARGEFSIVVAELGVASGLDQRLAPLAVTYVLLLTLAGPLLVRRLRHTYPPTPVSRISPG